MAEELSSSKVERRDSSRHASTRKSPPSDRKSHHDSSESRKDSSSRRPSSRQPKGDDDTASPLPRRTPEEELERSRRRKEERDSSRSKRELDEKATSSGSRIGADGSRSGSSISRRNPRSTLDYAPLPTAAMLNREDSKRALSSSPRQVEALLIDDAVRPKKLPSTLPAALDPASVANASAASAAEVRSASGKHKQLALLTVSAMEPLRPSRQTTNARIQRPGGSLRESQIADPTALPLPQQDSTLQNSGSLNPVEGMRLPERQNTVSALTPASPPAQPKSPRSPLFTPRSAAAEREKSPSRRPSLKNDQSLAKINASKMSNLTGAIPPLIKCLFEALRKKVVPLADFQALPQNLDKYRAMLQDLYTEKDLSNEESASLAGMTLTFLADLAEPVLPAFHFGELAKIAEIDEPSYRWKCIFIVLQRLPTISALLLTEIIKFVLKVGRNQFAGFTPVLMPLMTSTAAGDANSSISKDFIAVFCMFEDWEAIVKAGSHIGLFAIEDGLLTLRSASGLDELVDLAFNEYLPDALLLHTVLCTLRYYADPTETLKKIINLYRHHAPRAGVSAWRKRICDRIVDGLRLWLTRFVPEHTELWAHVLRQFMASLDGIDTSSMLKLLTAEEGMTALRAKMSKSSSASNSGPFPGVKLKVNSSEISLKDTSEKEIAAQLTLIDLDILKQIRRDELLDKAISNPDRSPNFTNMVQRFNTVGLWMASEVVKKPTPQERAEWLSKWIKLAKKLIRMNNFHSCYAIYCALHTASLQRLKLTWEKVPKKYIAILKDLSILFDQRQNYSAYRAAIAAARPPVVPYMIIFSKYLVAIEETSPTYEERPDGGKSINWAKMRYLYKVVDQVHSHQTANYAATCDLKINTSLRAYLQAPPHYEEEEIFHHSVIVEPKKGLNVLD